MKSIPSCDHHLVLGRTNDTITGQELPDTHDERYKQKLARFVLDEKGFQKKDLSPRYPLEARSGENRAFVLVDLVVELAGKISMIVKYGPGSLVTRERPSLAASRLIAPYQVPVVVVTNGEDAHIMDGLSSKVTGKGLSGIPDRGALLESIKTFSFPLVPEKQREMEARILYTFEAVGACNRDG